MPRLSKVKIDDLVSASKKYVDAQLKKADVNKNKPLTKTEAKKLTKTLRDNFANYVVSQEKQVSGTSEYVTKNTTSAATDCAHEAAFGRSAISYDKAFELALRAVAEDKDAGLPAFVREFGGPDGAGLSSPAAIKAEVKESSSGSTRRAPPAS